MKNKIALLLFYSGISRLCFRLSLLFYGKKHIRVVNYHDTLSRNNHLFEQQLRFYKRHYNDVSFTDLEAFFKSREWNKKKPGLIISFDDGLRSNFNHAVPLLVKWSFTGWFCIPSGFVDTTKEKQEAFPKRNRIASAEPYPDARISMNWNEINTLKSAGHVIVNHTMHHYRMTEADTEEVLQNEIRSSNQLIKSNTGEAPLIFCWVGGEEAYYTRKAFDKIKENFRYGFMTNASPVLAKTDPYFIDRTNIESFNSVPLVLFQLSGLMDLFYYFKRKRIKRRLL